MRAPLALELIVDISLTSVNEELYMTWLFVIVGLVVVVFGALFVARLLLSRKKRADAALRYVR